MSTRPQVPEICATNLAEVMRDRGRRRIASFIAILALVILAALPVTVARAKQPSYATPQQAVASLLTAVRAGRASEVQTILGPGSKALISSGDTVSDKRARARFVAAYDDANDITLDGDDKAVLVVGKDDWQFPFPIVKHDASWQFDASAGAQEILDRRIGANELDVIDICRAYVAAQREYALKDRDHDGFIEYAQKFLSSPGKRDGLYWPTGVGEEESPLGPLLANARAEGYSTTPIKGRQPYHGYFFKILTAQGATARDGAYDYIANGHMIGGFALVAFPAQYGVSGIMTFIVNHDGVVYQRDLGPRTTALASEMTLFNPDPSWSKTGDQSASLNDQTP